MTTNDIMHTQADAETKRAVLFRRLRQEALVLRDAIPQDAARIQKRFTAGNAVDVEDLADMVSTIVETFEDIKTIASEIAWRD